MATEAIGDRKVEASEEFAEELIRRGSPLLAAYWELREELGGVETGVGAYCGRRRASADQRGNQFVG
jgi:histidine ammonia-lyase